jgi:hypothetical protein
MMLMPLLKGPGDFAPWRHCIALVVEEHHSVQSAWPATKIAAVK